MKTSDYNSIIEIMEKLTNIKKDGTNITIVDCIEEAIELLQDAIDEEDDLREEEEEDIDD